MTGPPKAEQTRVVTTIAVVPAGQNPARLAHLRELTPGLLARQPRVAHAQERPHPAVIVSVAHLDDDERALVLGALLEELLAYTRSLPGTRRLRSLVVFDECYRVLPRHPANPPTKRPTAALMKTGPRLRGWRPRRHPEPHGPRLLERSNATGTILFRLGMPGSIRGSVELVRSC